MPRRDARFDYCCRCLFIYYAADVFFDADVLMSCFDLRLPVDATYFDA